MNYLSVEEISKRFGERLLFEGVTFGIDKGQKVALVAKNGAGKSTLLKLLSGHDEPDDGHIVFRKGVTVGYLDQQDVFAEGTTVLHAALDPNYEIHRAILEYAHESASGSPDGLQKALDRMNELNAWDADVKVKEVLTQLGLADFDKSVSVLSGGQKKRLALARLLAREPDFMILDEPTNHLDLDMIEWLEQRLIQSSSTVLMVTHDRYFLELVCSHIIELHDRTVSRYEGNFSTFLEKKQAREEVLQATIDKAKNLYRTELEWMRRMPKARGTKAKARKDAFYETEKVATTRIKQESLELKVKPERLGSKVLELHKVSLELGGQQLIERFEYIFKKNERVGIIGPNGVGKTSLLRLILGEMQPDTGKLVLGDTVKIGYYSQSGLQIKEDKRVIEVVRDIADVIPAEKGRKLTAAQMLERFLFPRDMHWQTVGTLSGGERKRLYLLTVLMGNPNFLILDEPTNDLDIYAMAALEEYLIHFEGCLIVVSHDRYFLDKVTEHLFVFQGNGQIKDHPGTYSSYLEKRKRRGSAKKDKAEPKAETKRTKSDRPKTKLSYKEKLEFETLETEIAQLEKEQRDMNDAIAQGTVDNPEEFYKRLAEIGDLLDTKSERWMELAEYV